MKLKKQILIAFIPLFFAMAGAFAAPTFSSPESIIDYYCKGQGSRECIKGSGVKWTVIINGCGNAVSDAAVTSAKA